MYSKIIKNDIRKSKLITVTIITFIFLAALLTSLTAALIVNLSGAIDNLMLEAKTPHFMQMHSGDIDMTRLKNFANSQSSVEAFQVLEFLNIDSSDIMLGENSLAGSVQDNGLSVKSGTFDLLLDLEGDIIDPADGEIYVPVYYMKEGMARIGDSVTIRGVQFSVAGFLRDSQMNSSMISSKRFLVSENDFNKIRDFGEMEYLIEFRFKDGFSISAFEAAYIEAGLEANGPSPVSYPLIKVANAITDGMMIAVLFLISILVVAVTFLCIRFTLLAKVEEDYREIGVLKAVGLRVSHIKKLYMAKYGVMAAAACIFGFLFSLVFQEPLMENIRLYMGDSGSDTAFLSLLTGIIGAAIIFLVVILYVNGVLRRFRKISPAQAIRFGAPQETIKAIRSIQLSKNQLFSRNVFLGIKDVLTRKKLYVTMFLVMVIASFIMIVPQNIYNTISARSFMKYMGIGSCDMRFDIQKFDTDNIPERTAEIAAVIARDESISRYTVLISYMFEIIKDDGTTRHLKVEIGDHKAFPIEYSAGDAPLKETDIALSAMNAEDLEKSVGDEIVLVIDGEEKHLTVCGIYSDITNGGKTAQAVFETRKAEVLWSKIPAVLSDRSLTDAKVAEYRERFSFVKVSNGDDYIDQSFGFIAAAIKKASYVSIATAILLSLLVTLLFMKMLVVKDRYSVAVLKSIGFTSMDIRRQYITRSVIVLVIGAVIGTVLSNTLGELVGIALISSFGASTFHFEINPLFAYLFSPLLIAVSVYIATIVGISDIGALKVSEYIKE